MIYYRAPQAVARKLRDAHAPWLGATAQRCHVCVYMIMYIYIYIYRDTYTYTYTHIHICAPNRTCATPCGPHG